MKIETERLCLSLSSDDEMMQIIRDEPCIEMKQAYSEMLQGCKEHPNERIWYAIWCIVLKHQPETIVGDFCFKGLNADGMVEIGYGLRDRFCKKGYMTETLKAICHWAIAQPGVTRIEAETTVDNVDSIKVLHNVGFVENGQMGEEGPRYVFRHE